MTMADPPWNDFPGNFLVIRPRMPAGQPLQEMNGLGEVPSLNLPVPGQKYEALALLLPGPAVFLSPGRRIPSNYPTHLNRLFVCGGPVKKFPPP